MINKKFKKLIKDPGVFFRDFLNQRYPISNCEQNYDEANEKGIYSAVQKIYEIENKIDLNDNELIDVVFTWVDDQDVKWQKKKNQSLMQQNDLGCIHAADLARFENHNELYYSVLAVQKFMPWVNQIFIITDDHPPSFLIDTNNIKFINHTDIIDAKYLPTFNSHVIEAHLHKIENLSENFIYFNDDFFVAKPLPKEHFFRKNGLASFFLSQKNIDQMKDKGMSTATLYASDNSRKLINSVANMSPLIPLVHTYVPLKKSTFIYAWEKFETEINAFLPNKFRGKNDLNMATFLVPWLMYINKESIISNEICYYFNIRSSHAKNQYRKLLMSKSNNAMPHSFCLNDVSSSLNFGNEEQIKKQLSFFLRNYFEV